MINYTKDELDNILKKRLVTIYNNSNQIKQQREELNKTANKIYETRKKSNRLRKICLTKMASSLLASVICLTATHGLLSDNYTYYKTLDKIYTEESQRYDSTSTLVSAKDKEPVKYYIKDYDYYSNTVMTVKTYDVTDLKLENIEDYFDLDLTNLSYTTMPVERENKILRKTKELIVRTTLYDKKYIDDTKMIETLLSSLVVIMLVLDGTIYLATNKKYKLCGLVSTACDYYLIKENRSKYSLKLDSLLEELDKELNQIYDIIDKDIVIRNDYEYYYNQYLKQFMQNKQYEMVYENLGTIDDLNKLKLRFEDRRNKISRKLL